MRALLVVIAGLLLMVVLAVPWYLGPDDLKTCPRPETAGTCKKADAIVAVSGGDTRARTEEAVRLYHAGWADTVIFSGAAADPASISNAEAMQKQAVAAGVPYEHIVTDDFSQNTKENAENTARFVKGLEHQKIIVVTSAYHQRRASLEFKAIVGKTVDIVSHPVATDKQWAGAWWWLHPTGWWLAGSELGKIVVFYTVQQGVK